MGPDAPVPIVVKKRLGEPESPMPNSAIPATAETVPAARSGARERGALLALGLACALLAAGLGYMLAQAGFGLGGDTGAEAGERMRVIVAGSGALLFLFAVTIAAVRSIMASRRQAEANDQLLAEAFRSLPTPRMVVDDKGRVIYVNPVFRQIFNCENRSPLGALAEYFAAAGGSRQEFERLQATAGRGVVARGEVEVPLESGESEWYEIVACPVANRPGHVIWRIEDVSAQRELEQVIRQEHETLFDFLEHAPVGFYSVNEDGRFLFVNQTLADWLGFTPEEILGGNFRLRNFVVAVPGRDAAPYDPFDQSGQTNGEVTLCGRDGRTLQAFVTQTVVPGSEGAGFRTRSVVRDLTPEREWEKALRVSERRFKHLFEDAPVGIALVDLSGNIAECNHLLHRFGSASGAPLLGVPILDLIADEDRVQAEALMRKVAGKESSGPIQVRLAGNPDRVASLFVSRAEDAAGGHAGLILHFLDITEVKKLELQFAQSQKMQAVGQLAGGIAHDFNNLLTAMIGFCDLLLLRHGPGEQSFADIMQIKQNANRAANLVRQLLAFSRRQTVQPKILNVTDILAEISNLLRRLIGEKIELKMIHGRDLAAVKVDQGQFEQVIVNLAVNARDAMPKGGTLTIRTGNVTNAEPIARGVEEMPPGDYVLIEVGDTGVGIPKSDIDRIFEPFYSTKEVGAGTGLGLSTVHGVVKQADGYIFVDSVVGEGTKFSIFLPRHQAAAVAAARQAAPMLGDLTGTGTVLLVEDEDAVRLFSARALRNKGYKVLEAKGGETAIELMKNLPEPVDLLITDIVMPDMDGPALVEWVRAREPDMRVICISGYAEDTFRKRIAEATNIHFLPKPFSLEQLAGKVKEVMREPTVH
jgi:two-component system cell cycle sensor histidine kinase/response regulator CckA